MGGPRRARLSRTTSIRPVRAPTQGVVISDGCFQRDLLWIGSYCIPFNMVVSREAEVFPSACCLPQLLASFVLLRVEKLDAPQPARPAQCLVCCGGALGFGVVPSACAWLYKRVDSRQLLYPVQYRYPSSLPHSHTTTMAPRRSHRTKGDDSTSRRARQLLWLTGPHEPARQAPSRPLHEPFGTAQNTAASSCSGEATGTTSHETPLLITLIGPWSR